MKRSRFTEEQIIGILRGQEAGLATADVCRKHGISGAAFHKLKSKFGGMDVSEARRLKVLVCIFPNSFDAAKDTARRLWYDRCLPSDLSHEAPAQAEARRRALFEIVNAARRAAAAVARAPACLQRRRDVDRGKVCAQFRSAQARRCLRGSVGGRVAGQCLSALATQTGRRQSKVCAQAPMTRRASAMSAWLRVTGVG
jgi:putative transposase